MSGYSGPGRILKVSLELRGRSDGAGIKSREEPHLICGEAVSQGSASSVANRGSSGNSPPAARRLRPASDASSPGVELLTAAVNSGRAPGSGPLKRAVRNKLAGKRWPGRSPRSTGQGSAVFEGGRVRLEADTTAARGAMMAASPSAAGGFTLSGLSVRKSEQIAELIDLFSKTQYRAKEVTPRVRWPPADTSSPS